MIVATKDPELILMLLVSGWIRLPDEDTFYWPSKRMPRA